MNTLKHIILFVDFTSISSHAGDPISGNKYILKKKSKLYFEGLISSANSQVLESSEGTYNIGDSLRRRRLYVCLILHTTACMAQPKHLHMFLLVMRPLLVKFVMLKRDGGHDSAMKGYSQMVRGWLM